MDLPKGPMRLLAESVITEGAVNRLWIRVREYFDMEYSKERTQEMVNDYLEDGRIQELKDFLVVIRMNVDHDKHSGFWKKLGQAMWGTAHWRITYLQYKREILPIIFHAANEITKAEGRKFDFEYYYANVTGEVDARSNEIQKYNKFYDMNQGMNPNLQALQVISSVNSPPNENDALGKFSSLHATVNNQYYNNPNVAANSPMNMH
jgi:hypothetical protein